MPNFEPITGSTAIFIGSAIGLGLAALIKSYLFKKKIANEDMYIAFYFLIAATLASSIRAYYALGTISWKDFWVYTAVFAAAQLVAQLGCCLFARCTK